MRWVVANNVLIYLRGIVEYRLRYLGGDGVRMQEYSDSNWVGSASSWKSTLGSYFSLGLSMIYWFNMK